MKKNSNTFFIDDRLFAFVDGRTSSEEDKQIIARMTMDSEFANMIEDLMDATNHLEGFVEADEEFDYSKTALAAFCENDLDTLDTNENVDIDMITDSMTTQNAKKLADGFLKSLDESEPKRE